MELESGVARAVESVVIGVSVVLLTHIDSLPMQHNFRYTSRNQLPKCT